MYGERRSLVETGKLSAKYLLGYARDSLMRDGRERMAAGAPGATG